MVCVRSDNNSYMSKDIKYHLINQKQRKYYLKILKNCIRDCKINFFVQNVQKEGRSLLS